MNTDKRLNPLTDGPPITVQPREPEDLTPTYFTTMGRRFKVTAVFKTDLAANTYLHAHPREGVIGECGGLVIIAHMDDEGEPL